MKDSASCGVDLSRLPRAERIRLKMLEQREQHVFNTLGDVDGASQLEPLWETLSKLYDLAEGIGTEAD